jgi:nucleoside phosphorylase
MVGIICPSRFEYDVLRRDRLSRRRAELVLSGMGKLRTLHACHALKQKHKSLRWILLVGFAGGLTPSLKIGDVIEPDVFIEQDYFAEPFEKFPNRIAKKGGGAKLLGKSLTALMLTQDRFLTENPYRNSPYARRFQRIACDMESYAVAYFCKMAKLNYSVVKLISDSADEKADKDFLKSCRRLSPKLNRIALQAVDRIGEI